MHATRIERGTTPQDEISRKTHSALDKSALHPLYHSYKQFSVNLLPPTELLFRFPLLIPHRVMTPPSLAPNKLHERAHSLFQSLRIGDNDDKLV